MNYRDALMTLNAVGGLGNKRILKLVEYFGTPQKILKDKAVLFDEALNIPFSIKRNIQQFDQQKFLCEEKALLAKYKVNVLTILDAAYPENLKQIPDAPVVLYVKGSIPKSENFSLAIVGSRKASVYGISVARSFAMGLSELGITIVSGLARGVDSAAHKATLLAGGKTLAVLGCGLAIVYPSENRELCDEISKNGAVLSEFPMKTPPLPFHFPRRNRIISGLSSGVIVVEAALRSGALLTADSALEQGREVFAVPGKVDSNSSRGVNKLIQQGAKLVTSIEDVLEEFAPVWNENLAQQKVAVSESEEVKIDSTLLNQERNVIQHISSRPIHLDHLTHLSGSDTSAMAAILLQLELKHLVKQLPGKLFVRSNLN